ncbi:MAG TPA: glycoside hydrolase family 172 protein [Alphaproteobacteria bacterium]|nr:glycoside hydrolase family 172 protein [Alphaproteobacteria bacterium]
MLKTKSFRAASAALLVLTGCKCCNPSGNYQTDSPLGSLPLPHPGTAMHAGSWDRTGGNRDFITVPAGKTITLLDQDGAGEIHRFWMTISPGNVQSRRQVILRMYWDNETNPSVECPIGDFFGVGFGDQSDFKSLPMDQSSGGYNCYWPMPFHTHARWTLENRSSETINSFYYNVDYTTYRSIPRDMLEFHACWRRENPTSPHRNYTILEANGEGFYAGVALFMQGLNMGKNKLAFLEGDEMIYIDQPNPNPPTPPQWHHTEAVPQINGTGTEDYFGGGWYFNHGPFSAPYHGCTIKDEKNSRVSTYRWHIEDAIPFHKNIRVSIEHGNENDTEADYSSVAYFYQKNPHEPYPPLPANADDLMPSQQ